jgi:hypothetical protein
VKFIRSGNHNGLNVLIFKHCIQAAVVKVNLQLFSRAAGTILGDIGNGDQPGIGHIPAQVFRVTPAHLSYSNNSDSQLAHLYS